MPVVFDTVERILRKIIGIVDMAWLTREDRQQAQKMEGDAGLNRGMLEVLARQHVCVALSGAGFRHESAPCVQWVAGGIVIGEEVTDPKRRTELLASPAVGRLGENFLLYYDRMKSVRGKEPAFVYRPLPFAEVAACREVRDVVSASPGSVVDLYLKRRFAWSRQDSRLGTILVGFNSREGP